MCQSVPRVLYSTKPTLLSIQNSKDICLARLLPGTIYFISIAVCPFCRVLLGNQSLCFIEHWTEQFTCCANFQKMSTIEYLTYPLFVKMSTIEYLTYPLFVLSDDHREITSTLHRGAKPCRLLYNWNLLLIILGSRHCTFGYINLLKEEGWKCFCRFVFVCFTSNFMNKLKFNDFLQPKNQK